MNYRLTLQHRKTFILVFDKNAPDSMLRMLSGIVSVTVMEQLEKVRVGIVLIFVD